MKKMSEPISEQGGKSGLIHRFLGWGSEGKKRERDERERETERKR